VESLQLAVDPRSPATARAFVEHLLELWGYDTEMIEGVRLMVSELAANAILHVGEPFTIEVDEVDQGVWVAVKDPSPLLPEVHDRGPLAEGGRGLRIVQALASDWDARALDGGGKVVWFIASPS
jgi:anti-sigma regulatory factor (Ser/Thr protein kinase)